MDMFIQGIANGILMGGVYALIAIGLTMIFGVMNVVNFAQGEFLMLGMFAAYFLNRFIGLDPFLLLIIIIPLFFLVGAALEKALISRILQSDISQILFTLGLSVFLINLALMIWGPNYKLVNAPYKFSMFRVGSVTLAVPRFLAFVAATCLIFILWIFVSRTDLGKALRATSEKPEVVILMGINPDRMHLIAFGIGIALAAAAGTIITPFFYTFPSVGSFFVLTAFVVVVLGGMGNVLGALIGALVIGVVESLTAQYVGLDLGMLGAFVAFVLILLFKPRGIIGGGRLY